MFDQNLTRFDPFLICFSACFLSKRTRYNTTSERNFSDWVTKTERNGEQTRSTSNMIAYEILRNRNQNSTLNLLSNSQTQKHNQNRTFRQFRIQYNALRSWRAFCLCFSLDFRWVTLHRLKVGQRVGLQKTKWHWPHFINSPSGGTFATTNSPGISISCPPDSTSGYRFQGRKVEISLRPTASQWKMHLKSRLLQQRWKQMLRRIHLRCLRSRFRRK